MKWRPSDWKNPHRSRTIRTQYLDGIVITEPRDDEAVHAMIYEAGADAVLEALRATGKPYFIDAEQGLLVAIPDDTDG